MSVPPPALDYRSLFDASPHPCLVLDPQGRVLTANRAYLAAGPSRGPDDLVGRHFRDAMPDAADRIAPIEASIARAVATGLSDTVEGGAEGPGWSITHVPVKDAAGTIGAVLHHPAAHPGPTRPCRRPPRPCTRPTSAGSRFSSRCPASSRSCTGPPMSSNTSTTPT